MNTDPLELLVDAYRAETSHRARDTGVLRARVLATAGARRRSRYRLVWLAAAAVLFMGSAALAARGREGVTLLLGWLRSEVGATNAPEVRKVLHVHRAAVERTVQTPAPPTRAVESEPSRTVVPLSALPVDEPLTATRQQSPFRAVSDDAPPAAAVRDLGAELSLYQRAHALHFGGGDPAAALDAWLLYLRSHPEGALAAEARLNQAVCLVKLGRRGEGRRILESLATGNAPQSSRQQARELLLVLGPDCRPVNP